MRVQSSVVERVATPVLLVCAVLMTGITAKRAFSPPEQQNRPITIVKNWRQYASAGSQMGPVTAPMTVVEFSDFQCPFCAVLHRRLDSLMAKYPNSIHVVFRHVPIDQLHPHARQAARASVCAEAQGRFAEFHDRLFSNQSEIGQVPWSKLALDVGLTDTVQFNSCLAGRFPDDRLTRDSIAAQELNLRGTPLILVNERLISGAPTAGTLDSLARVVLSK